MTALNPKPNHSFACADPTADAKLEADDDASLASSEEARGDDTGMTDDDSVEATAPWSCWEVRRNSAAPTS